MSSTWGILEHRGRRAPATPSRDNHMYYLIQNGEVCSKHKTATAVIKAKIKMIAWRRKHNQYGYDYRIQDCVGNGDTEHEPSDTWYFADGSIAASQDNQIVLIRKANPDNSRYLELLELAEAWEQMWQNELDAIHHSKTDYYNAHRANNND